MNNVTGTEMQWLIDLSITQKQLLYFDNLLMMGIFQKRKTFYRQDYQSGNLLTD